MEPPYIPHALPSRTVFDFLSQRHNKVCHFISDMWTISWLGKTSDRLISLTTWLAVNPSICNVRKGGAKTWLAYILAGIVYVSRRYMLTYNLLVRSLLCSRTNCLMLREPAVNGCGAGADQHCICCMIWRDVSVTNHAQILKGVCVGELRTIIKESEQIVSVSSS